MQVNIEVNEAANRIISNEVEDIFRPYVKRVTKVFKHLFKLKIVLNYKKKNNLAPFPFSRFSVYLFGDKICRLYRRFEAWKKAWNVAATIGLVLIYRNFPGV